MAQQQSILAICFHADYSGGQLQFLEDYENAFMNIDYVLKHQWLSGTYSDGSLYTNNGKQHLFVQNFTVPDLTAELIDTIENTTDTWDAMVDSLHQCLAKRTIHAEM